MTLAYTNRTDPFNIFGDFLNREWSASRATVKYPLDIVESKDAYKVKISLPGVEKGNLSVTIDKDILVIEAKDVAAENEEEKGTYIYKGIRTGSYKREISVKDYGVDSKKVTSVYKNGILTINMPKTKEAKPQVITVAMDG
jgi:HSP20 family protein